MAIQTVITKDKNKLKPNSYDWHGLSLGDLDMLARLCAANIEHPLAHDCFHEIINFFYDTDKGTYHNLKKLHE